MMLEYVTVQRSPSQRATRITPTRAVQITVRFFRLYASQRSRWELLQRAHFLWCCRVSQDAVASAIVTEAAQLRPKTKGRKK